MLQYREKLDKAEDAFANAVESEGAVVKAGATLDGSNVYLSALKENLDPSLDLYADMLRSPRFDSADIDRVKATTAVPV